MPVFFIPAKLGFEERRVRENMQEVYVIEILPPKFTSYGFRSCLRTSLYILVAANGIIKRTSLSKYRHIRKTGIRCLSFREDDDEVVDAYITKEPSMIFIATKNGFGILFEIGLNLVA